MKICSLYRLFKNPLTNLFLIYFLNFDCMCSNQFTSIMSSRSLSMATAPAPLETDWEIYGCSIAVSETRIRHCTIVKPVPMLVWRHCLFLCASLTHSTHFKYMNFPFPKTNYHITSQHYSQSWRPCQKNRRIINISLFARRIFHGVKLLPHGCCLFVSFSTCTALRHMLQLLT